MKKIKKSCVLGITLMLTMLGLITSCNKDEILVDPIVGIWEFSETTEDFSRIIKLTFNQDNTGLEEIDYIIYGQPDSNNSNFVYHLKGDILTLFYGVEPRELTYSISGNELTIAYPEEVLTFTRSKI